MFLRLFQVIGWIVSAWCVLFFALFLYVVFASERTPEDLWVAGLLFALSAIPALVFRAIVYIVFGNLE